MKTITAISSETITLDSALQYTHYGGSSANLNTEYGTLDQRARVGHLTRNIKIVPGPDADWGFTVYVYGYRDGNITRIGRVNLDSVLFENGGQLDTLNAPLTFMNVPSGESSTVTKNAFVNCKANCIYMQNVNGTNI